MTADPMTESRPELIAEQQPLAYDRTVPRQMVHRAAVAEVFVTDAVQVAERQVRVAVQLPPSHAYFGDHAGSQVDPLLLLEAARQAAIYGSHVVAVPLTDTMLISGSTLVLTRPELLRAASRPVRLVITNTFDTRKPGAKKRLSGYVLQQIELDGTVVGTHRLDALVMTNEQHAAVRSMVREGPIPTTAQMADEPHPEAVEAARVGRTHPANVVLAAAGSSPDGHRALVAPRFGNRALFDHVYDHLPGAVLIEAARQLALLATGVPHAEVLAITARFPRFAELDRPTVAHTPAVGPAATEIHVSFTQDGTEVASITVTVCQQPQEQGGAR
jgi:2-oxo-3-(phosphooxy)propyl 3-oxoalkanoate synthase